MVKGDHSPMGEALLLRSLLGLEKLNFLRSNSQPMTERRSRLVVGVIVLIAIFGAGCLTKDEDAGKIMEESGGTMVLLETNMGDVTILLRDDMPVTAGNFKKLVTDGFYDGVVFHRVIDGFMIQGGDPTGTGRGGPGYAIKDEFSRQNRNDRGTISMANAGPNTGGSQFFINLVDNNYLDRMHPVFGEVAGGMEVVDRMGKVKTGAGDRPLEDVVIVRARVVS
jgi:peptidylprolyl isomerase